MATEKPRRRSDVVVRSGRLDAVEAVPFDHAELRRLGRKLAGAAELHREALEGPQGRIFFLRASDRSALRGCRTACRVRLFPQDVSARRTRGAVSREERRIGLSRAQGAGREVPRYLFDVHAPSAIPFPGPVHRAQQQETD
jgi:hypothetical protein